MDYPTKPLINLIDFDIEVNTDMFKDEVDEEFQISCIERIGELTVLKRKIEEDLPITLDEEKIIDCLIEMWIRESYELKSEKKETE